MKRTLWHVEWQRLMLDMILGPMEHNRWDMLASMIEEIFGLTDTARVEPTAYCAFDTTETLGLSLEHVRVEMILST